ncbi:acyltransferase family protein [Sphingobium baderi]|uniref:acyltransferase family protein n=1 Tax=Sphingobium baderi TaxID=1332080 RepID=UPI002B401D0A|nr:acyltransferase [Sphingobium baderi]WRD78820.1 acyltransferase [Sphingobium baderi]
MIPNVQILRALAALMVVFHHGLSATGHYAIPALSLASLNAIGQSGVDLFFVISGFVMVVSTHYSPKSPAEFLLGRIRRIVPIYWILTLALAALLLVTGRMLSDGGPMYLLLSLMFSSQVMTGAYPVLFLGWTLEYEMFFYVLFALGLALPLRNGEVIVPTAVIIALSLLFPVAIAIEFIFGMVVARLYLAGVGSRFSGAVALSVGFILLLGSLAHPQPLELRWALWGVPASLIVYGAVVTDQLHLRGLIFLGDASYSIYLIQAFLITLTFKAMVRFLPGIAPELQVLIATLSTTLAGAAMYVALERPLLKAIRRQ